MSHRFRTAEKTRGFPTAQIIWISLKIKMWPHENALFLKPMLKHERKFVLYEKQHITCGSALHKATLN